MVNCNFENFHRFRWKNCQNRKIVIFWYFTKIDITQVQNDIESWNLAKLCTIILSKKWSRHFLIFYVFFEILPNLSKIWSKSWKKLSNNFLLNCSHHLFTMSEWLNGPSKPKHLPSNKFLSTMQLENLKKCSPRWSISNRDWRFNCWSP